MSKPRVFFLSSDEQAFAIFKDEFLPRLNKEIPLQSACLCTSFSDALAQLHRDFDIYISDFDITSEHGETGLDFYQSIRINNDRVPFVMLNMKPNHSQENDQNFHLGDLDNISEFFDTIKVLLLTLPKNF